MMFHGSSCFRNLLLACASVCLSLPAMGADVEPKAQLDPKLETLEQAHLVLTRMPLILTDEEVARHLTTGLTTTFVFRFEAPAKKGGKIRGAARIEVRYELWDEIFHTQALGVDGKPRHEQLQSLEALHAWWSHLKLPILDLQAQALDSYGTGKIEVDVVPFSQAERDDTERWLYDSARRAGNTARPPSLTNPAGESQGNLEQVFTVLIATSLRSRAVTSFRWDADLPARKGQP